MYIFYIDHFFWKNIVLIAIVSFFTLQLLTIHVWAYWKRILIGAVIGSGIETILLLICNNYRLFAIGSQIVVMPIVLYFLQKDHKKESKLRMIILSYAIVFLFVGIANGMQNLLGCDTVTQIGFWGIVLIVEAIILELKRIRHTQRNLYDFEIGYLDKSVRGTALYDSGNRLCDPWEKRAVHIVSNQLLQQLQLEAPKWMVPYQALGNEHGVLEVYEADWLIVLSREERKRLTKVLLGKAQEGLLKNKQYQMILNESVFENGE